MSRPKVYLAGPITGLTYDDAQDWRDDAARVLEEHGIEALSPLRGKDYLRPLGTLDDAGDMTKSAYAMNKEWPLSTPKGITMRDHNDVRNADAVLAYLKGAEKVSVGTVMEIAWAFAYRVPSIVVYEDGNPHQHAMINESSGLVLDDLDLAIRCILTIVHGKGTQ